MGLLWKRKRIEKNRQENQKKEARRDASIIREQIRRTPGQKKYCLYKQQNLGEKK